MLGLTGITDRQTCRSEPKAELQPKMMVVHFIASQGSCDFA